MTSNSFLAAIYTMNAHLSDINSFPPFVKSWFGLC